MKLEDYKPQVQSLIKRHLKPGMTIEQAYEAWKAEMRVNARKGGKSGTGNEFAHGKISPSEAGKKGSNKRWGK